MWGFRNLYEITLGLGLVAAFFAGKKALFVGLSLGLLDDPKAEAHKEHHGAVPQVGSVLLLCGLVALAIGAALWGKVTVFLPIIICAFLIGVLGIVDDRLKLSWRTRFVFLWSIVGLLLFLSPDLLIDKLVWSWGQTSDLGFLGGIGFTALCLVGLVIALNMMDGFNGGILSQGIVWLLMFANLASGDLATVFLYLAMTLLVILAFNMPSKLFMGDGGAYALGLVLGASAIMMYGAEPETPVYADTIVVWLALPVFDCLRVIFMRVLKGLSPFQPRRDHLHHLLMKVVHRHAGLAFSFLYTATAVLAALWRPEYSWLIVLAQLLVLGLTVSMTSRMAKLGTEASVVEAE